MTKKKTSTVQDDSREIQLAELCGLEHLPGRAGPDAQDEFGNPYELKSTTRSGVSTARDVGLRDLIIRIGQKPTNNSGSIPDKTRCLLAKERELVIALLVTFAINLLFCRV